MKKTVWCAVLLFIGTCAVQAQEIYPMAVGPFITLKAGTNAATIPDGHKTGIQFNGIPDFGATGYLPFSKSTNIGLLADLGYSTYAIVDKPYTGATDDNTFVYKYSYLTLSPCIDANVFTFGFNIGIPLSASKSNTSGTMSSNLKLDSVTTLLELRLGAMVPLVSSPTGRLDLSVQVGYMLNGIVASTPGASDPKAASIALGLNYLFTVEQEKK